MLRENKEYDFDFDNQLIPTEKFDASYFENGWLTYNPYQYDDENVDGIRTLSKATTHASGTIPFQYNTCTSISLDYAPYSLGIIKEFDDKISLYLTNYEGGKDVITIHGATSKPTFTPKIWGSGACNISEQWADGVYTITVTHNGGAVDIIINCSGNASNRKIAKENTQLVNVPTPPKTYTGVLQYEAELADYKNVTVNKSGYNKCRSGYYGQGFGELTENSSRLRFYAGVPQTGNYYISIRYQADDSGKITLGSGDSFSLIKSGTWLTAKSIVSLKDGVNTITNHSIIVCAADRECVVYCFRENKVGHRHRTLAAEIELHQNRDIPIEATDGQKGLLQKCLGATMILSPLMSRTQHL